MIRIPHLVREVEPPTETRGDQIAKGLLLGLWMGICCFIIPVLAGGELVWPSAVAAGGWLSLVALLRRLKANQSRTLVRGPRNYYEVLFDPGPIPIRPHDVIGTLGTERWRPFPPPRPILPRLTSQGSSE